MLQAQPPMWRGLAPTGTLLHRFPICGSMHDLCSPQVIVQWYCLAVGAGLKTQTVAPRPRWHLAHGEIHSTCRHTKNLDLDAQLEGCLEAATMNEDQALTFRIAVLSVMNIIFGLLDAKVDTLVLAAIATVGILLPWAENEIRVSLMGCCGKSLKRLVSGLGRPDLLRLAYLRPGGTRAVTFLLAEMVKLWKPGTSGPALKTSLDKPAKARVGSPA